MRWQGPGLVTILRLSSARLGMKTVCRYRGAFARSRTADGYEPYRARPMRPTPGVHPMTNVTPKPKFKRLPKSVRAHRRRLKQEARLAGLEPVLPPVTRRPA